MHQTNAGGSRRVVMLRALHQRLRAGVPDPAIGDRWSATRSGNLLRLRATTGAQSAAFFESPMQIDDCGGDEFRGGHVSCVALTFEGDDPAVGKLAFEQPGRLHVVRA
jgi:hypothetical protein